MKRKILCILIESYQREFMIRLYMALHAADRGYQVIITEQYTSIARRVRDSILFNKDHAMWSKIFFKKKLRRRLRTCALDEEALIVGDRETYLRTRVSPELLRTLDAIFVWGEVQLNIVSAVAPTGNFNITGSPKFDLCELFRRNSQKSRSDRRGKIKRILINTRFTYTNPINGSIEALKQQLQDIGFFSGHESEAQFIKLIECEWRIQEEFERFITFLSARGNFEITIRPHPAEAKGYYFKYSEKYKNVNVDNVTDLRAQIISHDCVIHDGCTTAMEARALGVPVFGLRPDGLENAYDDYANQYSLNFNEAEKLCDYVADTDLLDIEQPDVDGIAKKGIDNWGCFENNATIRMLDAIDSLTIEPMEIFKRTLLMKLDAKRGLYKLLTASTITPILFSALFKKYFDRFKSGIEISNAKFPDIKINTVLDDINLLCELDERLSAKGCYCVQAIGPKSILVYK